MAFKENYTKIIDGNVHFNIDAFPGETTDLLEYVNRECKKCRVTASIDNPPECECPTARLYYAMVKLAIAEKQIEEFKKTLIWIENRCVSIYDDSLEADKVDCHASAIKYEIARVYPKYLREGDDG